MPLTLDCNKLSTSMKKQRTLSSFFATSHIGATSRENKNEIVGNDKNQSRFQLCVICNKNIPRHVLIRHASKCNGESNSIAPMKIPYHSQTTVESRKSVIEQEVDNAGRFSKCPVCDKSIPYYNLNRHAQFCNGVASVNTKELDQSSCSMGVTDEDGNALQELIPSSEPLPGLFLFENFITEDEEERITRFLDSSPLSSDHNKSSWKFATFNGRHFGQRWGVHCNLRDRQVYAETPLPSCVDDLTPKLSKLRCMKGCIPNEANAIDYRRKAGHWLKSHVDDRQLSREAIANLSLAGDCFMTFRYEKKKKKLGSIPDEHKVLLKRRTLSVLTGMARYDYSHGISNQDLMSDRRISLTMRQSPLTTNK